MCASFIILLYFYFFLINSDNKYVCRWNYNSLLECKQRIVEAKGFAVVWRPETTVHESPKSPSTLMHNQITFLVMQHDNVSKTFICLLCCGRACSLSRSHLSHRSQLLRFNILLCYPYWRGIDITYSKHIAQIGNLEIYIWRNERSKNGKTTALPRNRREKRAR